MREERNSGSNVCSRAWSVDVTLMCWCMLLLLFVGSVAGGSSNIKIGVLDNKANLTATFLQWQPTFENYLNSKLSALHINFSVSVVPLAFDNLTSGCEARRCRPRLHEHGALRHVSASIRMESPRGPRKQTAGRCTRPFWGCRLPPTEEAPSAASRTVQTCPFRPQLRIALVALLCSWLRWSNSVGVPKPFEPT